MARKNFRATGGIDIDTATIPVTVIQETITSNSTTTVDSISLTSFVSAEYTVTLKQGSKIRTSKVIMQTDGTSVDMAEYGITETGGLLSGVVISATASGGNALLQITVTDAASTLVRYKLIRSISTKIGYIPDAPTIGTATGGYDLATVTFTAPTDDGGSAITTYTATSNPSFIAVNTATSPAEFTTLPPGVNYTFTITATNEFGTSIESSASNSVLVSSVPAQVTGLTATDFGTSRAFNNGRIDLSWVAPANNGQTITGYRIQRSTDGTNYSTLVADTGTTGTTYSDTGLTSAQIYYYRVAAININGTGTNSTAANATATTVPQAPTIGTATSTGATGTVTVAYTANATGGKIVTTFTATSNPGSITATGASPITVTGLTNGTSYTFTVTATNANGTSAASSASNSATPTGPATVWTARTSNMSARTMGIAYGHGLWVIGGRYGRIRTSTDTISWVTRTSNIPTFREIWSIEYGNGIFLAVGSYGVGARSTNGTTWVTNNMPAAAGTAGSIGTRRVRYANGIWMATGYGSGAGNTKNVLASSTDGLTWSGVGANLQNNYFGGRGIAYGHDRWLFLGSASGPSVKISQSTNNGATWTTVSVPLDANGTYDIAYGNGIFVAPPFNSGTRWYTSTNGTTWISRTNAAFTRDYYSIGYGNGNFVMINDFGTAAHVSTDGITWNAISPGSDANAYGDGPRYVGGMWILGGGGSTNNNIYTAPG